MKKGAKKMNKNLRNKLINEKIIQITEMILKINSQTNYVAWMEFAGHVSSVIFTVGESKQNWRTKIYTSDHIYVSFDFNENERLEKAIEKLISVQEEISKFLEKK